MGTDWTVLDGGYLSQAGQRKPWQPPPERGRNDPHRTLPYLPSPRCPPSACPTLHRASGHARWRGDSRHARPPWQRLPLSMHLRPGQEECELCSLRREAAQSVFLTEGRQSIWPGLAGKETASCCLCLLMPCVGAFRCSRLILCGGTARLVHSSRTRAYSGGS